MLRALLPRLILAASLLLAVGASAAHQASREPGPARVRELKLWNTASSRAGAARGPAKLLVEPGDEQEARDYYDDGTNPVRKKLPRLGKPGQRLRDTSIDDMLVYFGFPALPPQKLQDLPPGVVMDYEQLRKAIGSREFDDAYKNQPLQPGEILVARFFAPKIINVHDKQEQGVPKDGFGWRRVLRFKARSSSPARGDGLATFYLLFNFTSKVPSFPENTNAGQIQGMLVPVYPRGQHRDAYFLVYDSLGSATPGKVGFFLKASFDLAGSVPPGERYYVPRACGQCHGTEFDDQERAKVNYLDTDHWIDRTKDDFTLVPEAKVLVDGAATLETIRALNREIETQNADVLKQSGGPRFALLAVQKWLELHKAGSPLHAPPLSRGFVENNGDRVWRQGVKPDEDLLPLLNQYCFRCHSSVRFHVFQKQAVFARKAKIIDKITTGEMPQDRVLPEKVKNDLLKWVGQLQ